MSLKQTTISGKHWLDKGPAESYLRMIADGLPVVITSAGRTFAEQKRLYDRWKAGIFKTTGAVSPPGSVWSRHEVGNAVDVPEPARAWMHKHGAKYGWINPSWAKKKATYEPWHFEYDASKDTRRTTAKTLKVDGDLGPATVREWQRQLGGLKADGVRGPATNKRIKARLNGKRGRGGYELESDLPLDGIDTARQWKAIQKLLNVWHARGVLDLVDGPLKIDGLPGPRTIKALQKSLKAKLWEQK